MKLESTAAAQAMRRSLKKMGGLTTAEIEEVVFHMTDWENDLSEYVAFLRAPNVYSDGDISALLIRFLVHVPAHVSSAAEVLLTFDDERQSKRRTKTVRARRAKRKKAA